MIRRSSIGDRACRAEARLQPAREGGQSAFGNGQRSRLLALAVLLLTTAASATAQTVVRVEFTSAGECAVSAQGPTGRASVKSPLRTSELKCRIALPRDAGAVDLEVLMPPGAGRPAGEFPRLAWAERDGRWVGTASLPGAPAFVSVLGPARGPWRERALDLVVLVGALVGAVWAVAKGREP